MGDPSCPGLLLIIRSIYIFRYFEVYYSYLLENGGDLGSTIAFYSSVEEGFPTSELSILEWKSTLMTHLVEGKSNLFHTGQLCNFHGRLTCILSHPIFSFDSGANLFVAAMTCYKDHFFNANQYFGPCSMVLMHLHASLLHVMIRYFGFDPLWLDALILFSPCHSFIWSFSMIIFLLDL